MKTRTFRKNWLIFVLGIAAVGGGFFLIRAHLRLEEQIRSAEQWNATLDGLREDCHLGEMMMRAQLGGSANTAHGLDRLLSANLSAEAAGIASADTNARAMLESVARYVDRRRPPSMPLAADVRLSGGDHEVAEQGASPPTVVTK